MQEEKCYHAAVYLRLSRDDGFFGDSRAGMKTESDSISSQRELICAFVKKERDIQIYDFYTDDGWSGTSFERPAFARMMGDIRAGFVDCVIVKDLSRLGRDYIGVGRLLQKIFPAFCVRFIALTDRFDSLRADENETSLVVPVKNFVNDAYARDISEKVKSHQRLKRENGQFIGAFAVYGYKKSEENRNRLAPDIYAAGIVRHIFAWKLEGYSSLAIAEKLNGFGILPPLAYKRLRGERLASGFSSGQAAGWSAVAVKRILTNETYIGTLVQGKEEKVSYKVKRTLKKPPEEWTRARGAHEAIVAEEDFRDVQALLKIDTRAKKGEKKAHLFAGLLFCGGCKKPLLRRVSRAEGKRAAYYCPLTHRTADCAGHSISEEALGGLVLSALRQQVALSAAKTRVPERAGKLRVHTEELDVFARELEALRAQRDKYRLLRARLAGDLEKGVITEADCNAFGALYESRVQMLERAVRGHTAALGSLRRAAEQAGRLMAQDGEMLRLERLTLLTFVKRIEVYDDRRVYVELKCREPFSEAVCGAGRRSG